MSFAVNKKYCMLRVGQSRCVITANAKQSAEYVIPKINLDLHSGVTWRAINAIIGR
jgi:hypothetical protein